MRHIKAAIKNQMTLVDLTLIAKEMVNVFHRTEYWDIKSGDEIKNPSVDTYLSCERGSMKVNIHPNRGYIYIHGSENMYAMKMSMKSLVDKLYELFNTYNKWPRPQHMYTYTDTGSNKNSPVQFTLTEQSVPSSYAAITVTDSDPHAPKGRISAALMIWHVMTKRSILKYTVTGNTPPIHILMMAPTMIVYDTKHTIMVDHAFRSLSYPPVPSHISVHLKPTIAINRYIGIIVHLYNNAIGIDAKNHPGTFQHYYGIDHKLQKYTSNVNDITTTYEQSDKLFEPKSVLKTAKVSQRATYCSVCKFTLFEKFYLLELDNHRTVLCAVCAHFNKTVNQSLNAKKACNVYVVDHPVDVANYITSLELPNTEETILQTLHKDLQARNVQFYNNSDPLINSLNLSYSKWVLRSGDMLGIEHSMDIADVINDSDILPKNTLLFKYEIW